MSVPELVSANVKLTPQQLQIYIDNCLSRRDAPLKPEYLQVVLQNRATTYQPLRDALGLEPLVKDVQEVSSSSLPSLGVECTAQDVAATLVKPVMCDVSGGCSKRKLDDVCQGTEQREEPPAKRSNTDDNGGYAADVTKGRSGGRGQNKNRSQNVSNILEMNSKQFCSTLSAIADGKCSFGDSCKYSHDRVEFIKTKPADVGIICKELETCGVCRYGINCRFGASHIVDGYNVNKENVVVTESILRAALNCRSRLHNEFSDRVRSGLRKRTFNFGTDKQYEDRRNKGKHFVELKTDLKDPLIGTPEPNESAKTSSTRTTMESSGPVLVSCGTEDGSHHNGPDERQGLIVTLDSLDKAAHIGKTSETLFCSGKRMLAPLTTLGNLPFRRLCVSLGAEVTMTEMTLAGSIVSGKLGELALLKRHPSEKYFGVQVACGQPRVLAQCAAFIESEVSCDFMDLNCALESVGVDAFIIHGRTSRQRYAKTARWDYLTQCKEACSRSALIGSGDVMSWEEYNDRTSNYNVDSVLIGRGALIKPWIFTEIKEQRLWDISATERLDFMKDFVNFGLENWGCDSRGVETTRKYLLELCSFTHRYIPVGLLEKLPQSINWRPPPFVGRSDLETLLASPNVHDWIRLSEMFLGSVPKEFKFIPKHKSSSYDSIAE